MLSGKNLVGKTVKKSDNHKILRSKKDNDWEKNKKIYGVLKMFCFFTWVIVFFCDKSVFSVFLFCILS